MTVLLSHACLPLERTPDQFAAWSRAMSALARRPNVMCKISTVVGASQPDWSVASVRPWVLGCVESFGPDRVHGRLELPDRSAVLHVPQLIDVYRQSIADLTAAERMPR